MSPSSRPSVCVVGSGWRFTSGISYYTCRLTSALARNRATSAVLMRQLIPRRLYPGASRVGDTSLGQPYPSDVRVFDGVDWFWIPSIVRAIRFLRAERPDVVVFQWWTGAVLHTYLLLAFVARRLGAKVVVEFHETQDTGEARMRGVARYVRSAGRRFVTRADAWVVHSEFDRRAVTDHFGSAVEQLAVVPHGPYDHHGTAVPDDDPARVPAEGDEHTVLFFGTIRPYKGLEHLVAAFNSLTPDEAARVRLLIVGETWEGWHEPLDLVAASPYRERIEVVNRYVRDDEVGGFFGRADSVALPYTRSSASGPLHIAMAHGLPVVLSDVGGLRDGAGDYEGIDWVAPASPDQLRRLLVELPARPPERFAHTGTWTRTADEFETLFKAIGA